MPEKTMKSNKSIILLRSFSILCFVAVVFSCLLFPASAEGLNYRDYEVSVTVDGNNDIVSLSFPFEQWVDWTLRAYNSDSEIATGQGDCFVGEFPWMDEYEEFYLRMAPFGGAPTGSQVSPYKGHYLSTDNIPSDAKWSATISVLLDDEANTLDIERFSCRSWGVDGSSAFVCDYISPDSWFRDDAEYLVSFSGDVVTNYDGWFPQFVFFFSADSSVLWSCLQQFDVTMSINSYYRVLDDMGYKEKIDELRQELEQQNIKLDDLIDQQEQINDKLDKLPGQIGDEMQGIIDNEKQEAEGSGNDFVDQILDALPDPSTDVLAALKSLTGATAYTGTDAVLPIPAIVLPGIDGLFPETVIWEGTEFDFGEYLGFIPSSLLTLVQALFTIAIVLFCVYELKGIISYCLTLRENKGG